MKKLLLLTILAIAAVTSAHAQCSANFTYTVTSVNPPVVTFQNNSSGDSTGGGISFFWDFGDGNTSTNMNPFHTYSLAGSYTVCLSMSDNSGCTDTVCILVDATVTTPSLNTWLITDSMTMYACIAPSTVTYYYSISGQNLSAPDTVVNVTMHWGDGSDSTWILTGTSVGSQGVLTHAYTNAGTYTAQLEASDINGITTSSSTGQQVIVAASCGSVSGRIYNDLNGNCVYDAGEEIQNIGVTISTGGQFIGWTQSDNMGNYSFNVPTGNVYDVNIQTNNGFFGMYTPSCPASGTLNITSVPSTGNDFGITCPQGVDVTGTVTGWRFRPGITTSVCVFAYNLRCTAASGQIELTFDPDLTPLADTAGIGYTVNGQTVTLPISGPDFTWNFCIPVAVSANAQIGDSVCVTMNIIEPDDSVPANNTGTFCFEVRNSYDPNDKYATPAGAGAQGAILPNTPIDYTIRFQNTGNDVAYNIYILDTLDSDLDPATVEVTASSHTMTYTLLAGNILRFNFDNIMLADSFSNEAASHGYVSYRISQNNNLAQSTQINNSASIFFDFNSPIYTNTTLNTVDYTLSVPVVRSATSFSIYPNPASDKTTLRFTDNNRKLVTITDAVGKIVYNHSASGILILNTTDYSNGIYTIRVTDGSLIETSKLIIGLH